MSIYKKLLQFQEQNVKVEKDGVNPHYKSDYTTLNEVLDKVRGPLNKLKVVIIQSPEATGLRTTLLDTEDDTKVESFLPFVEMSTAQKIGSNLSYNRRYSLITLLGLESSDDDGEVASKPAVTVSKVSKAHMDKMKQGEVVPVDDLPF